MIAVIRVEGELDRFDAELLSESFAKQIERGVLVLNDKQHIDFIDETVASNELCSIGLGLGELLIAGETSELSEHGRWIENAAGEFTCSNCGALAPLNIFGKHRAITPTCGECKSIMDKY